MGKIIRNGVEYSGAVEDATAVNYDNSLSGLNAQTVQEAVDEVQENVSALNDNLNKKTLWAKNLSLNSPVEINFTGCDKIVGYVNCKNGNGNNIRLPFELYSDYLTDGQVRAFYLTHYNGESSYITIQINLSTTSIEVLKMTSAGTWSSITGIVFGKAF